MSIWSDKSDWWLRELVSDHTYQDVVTPLLLDVLDPLPDYLYLDLGCGEGRVMRAVAQLGASVYGLDMSEDLIRRVQNGGLVADLTHSPIRDDSFDAAYLVLVLEHVPDHQSVFEEAARMVKQGGVLALVSNHPVWTAPGSTPISDTDGEVLWRSGEYFSTGFSKVPAGETTIVFHHRTMGALLNGAASAGWCLERMIERPHHEFDEQGGIPRLIACRWRLTRQPD